MTGLGLSLSPVNVLWVFLRVLFPVFYCVLSVYEEMDRPVLLLLMTTDKEECHTPKKRPTEYRPRRRPRTNITGLLTILATSFMINSNAGLGR